ncbi:HAMP domain-containing sensor histidine kinase [Collinsella sp. An2]|uniref:sensor histidine kinase n=1 Tax=Collinsella sp. An2 TaxID=1965585 RepID=UPI000B567D28|nr:HAMP domain-containing sensor histidine kinase [Collinsella sp. An2]OUP08925.1 hypothetical protein B5F33_06055 [Collinsella sp. An2]
MPPAGLSGRGRSTSSDAPVTAGAADLAATRGQRQNRERLRFAVVIIAGIGVGIMLYLLLFRFVDDGLNGAFVNWFFNTFVSSWEVDYQTNTTYNLVFDPVGAKEFFLRLGLIFVIVLVVVSAGVARWYARRRSRATVEEAASLLSFYMRHDAEASEVFPEGYDALALQATQMKGTMLDHERALRDEAARKNDLITYLAHDLKTPLTSVIGYLSLLDEIPEMPMEQRCRYVGITLDKARRLERLINEFFDITRYNLTHIELELEPVDLSFLLVQMADEFYPLLGAHGNTVRLEVEGRVVTTDDPGPALMIMGDAARLARVFNNILKNAIAYSHEGTEIAVVAEHVAAGEADISGDSAPAASDGATACADSGAPEDGSAASSEIVRVAVTDEGVTIPPHKLEAIFDKFFRLDEARASSTGGAGLGLAIAREIVELHGGRIFATSEAGRTTFTVELPME